MQKKSFKIDNDIYSQDAIKQAIKDFSESYSFEFIEDILNIEAEDENEIEEIF
ncbi:MAG: hypothetical protein LBQ24_02150 [Candidatus Peribacteria bacterium]|jgi:hypothetical protein|nr:hypothetical protein [Candidatus Peribacteria bacterium]